MTDHGYRELARALYATDDIEIDDNAEVIRNEPEQGCKGLWVASWVYIEQKDTEQ